jgi:hypothetical protein
MGSGENALKVGSNPCRTANLVFWKTAPKIEFELPRQIYRARHRFTINNRLSICYIAFRHSLMEFKLYLPPHRRQP